MSALSNPKVGGPIVAVVLLCAVGLAAKYLMSSGEVQGRSVETEWFFDEDAGTLFAGPVKQISPITVDGRKGVRAFVYSCGSCDDEAARKIVYVERYTEDVHQKLVNGEPVDAFATLAAHQVRTIDGEWLHVNTDEGSKVQGRFLDCSGAKPVRCFPQ